MPTIDDSTTSISNSAPKKLGDRIRDIADQLRQEDEIQIRATSRILGAAAKLAQNHDQLIDEVVDMVEEDLRQEAQQEPVKSYTVQALKQQFKTLKAAKEHFGVKANSWDALASKLNQPATKAKPSPALPQEPITERIEAIEENMQRMQQDIHQISSLLKLLLDGKSLDNDTK